MPVQNIANAKSVTETALATMSETPLPGVVQQIMEDEKKQTDPELVRASALVTRGRPGANGAVLLRCAVCDVGCRRVYVEDRAGDQLARVDVRASAHWLFACLLLRGLPYMLERVSLLRAIRAAVAFLGGRKPGDCLCAVE